jgi:5-methylcytosine-specific restriction endonuclease McrA
MQQVRQKRPRLKLTDEEYTLLRRRVLERDGWRCQHCGSSKDLHVHHLSKRSRLGDDVMDNLIALCATCHKSNHLSSANSRTDSFRDGSEGECAIKYVED